MTAAAPVLAIQTNPPTTLAPAPDTTSRVLDALRAIAEPTRLRILAILHRGERSVSEIADLLGQSQPRVSRHLKVLADAHLIDRVSEGGWVFCRLREHPLTAVALDLARPNDPAMASDAARIDVLDRERALAAERYFQTHAAEWDSIRSLYVSEGEVEQLLLDAVGTAPIDDLLDLGTGTGRVLELLALRARRAVGIDRSSAMLAAARPGFARPELRHVQLRHADMTRLPLASDSIDLAVFHQVLHFADDPGRALREVARVIRPTGRILVVDFAPHTLEFLREHHAHRRLGFTTDDLQAWAQSTGLLVREVARRAGTPLTVVLWELHPIASAPSHT